MVITIGSVTAFPELAAGADGGPSAGLPSILTGAQGLTTDDGALGAGEPAPFHVPAEQCHSLQVAAKQRVEVIAHNRDRADGRVEEPIRHHSRDQPLGRTEPPRLPDQVAGDQARDDVADDRDEADKRI